MATAKDDYTQAMGLIDKNLRSIDKRADPMAWNSNAALGLLVRGIQQDMADLKKRLGAIDSTVTNLR
jgi:hypothetical protein